MQRMPDHALWPVRGVIKGDICPLPLGVICEDCASAAPGRGLPAPVEQQSRLRN